MLGPYSYQSPSSLRERKRDVGINLVGLGTASALGNADLEAVLEALVDVLDVAHTATAGGLSSLGLLTPVDCIAKNIVSQVFQISTPPSPKRSKLPKHNIFMKEYSRRGNSYTCGS